MASSLPVVLGGEAGLGGRLFAAAVDDGALAEDAAGVAADRPQVLDLEAERGVADAERAASCGRRSRAPSRGSSPRSRRGRRRSGCSAPPRARRRRRRGPPRARSAPMFIVTAIGGARQLAGDQRPHVVDPRQLGPGGGGRHRVRPLQRPRAGRRTPARAHRRPRRVGGATGCRRAAARRRGSCRSAVISSWLIAIRGAAGRGPCSSVPSVVNLIVASVRARLVSSCNLAHDATLTESVL